MNINYDDQGITMTCTRCGKSLSDQEAAIWHPPACRQPRLYWWPRENPWHLAALAFIVGVIVGVLPW